jgi:ABC-type sugar transport system permease subunit
MSEIGHAGAQGIARPLKRRRDPERSVFIALMLLPALLFLLLFMYYPIEETFRLSLMRSTGLSVPVFYGLNNYIRLFNNEEFLAGLLHVFQWAFFSVIIQIPLAFFVAFSLTNYGNTVTRPLRAIYYLANVLPSAITAMLGMFIFSPTGDHHPRGPLNISGWLQRPAG